MIIHVPNKSTLIIDDFKLGCCIYLPYTSLDLPISPAHHHLRGLAHHVIDDRRGGLQAADRARHLRVRVGVGVGVRG